jgi:hypothetical protein
MGNISLYICLPMKGMLHLIVVALFKPHGSEDGVPAGAVCLSYGNSPGLGAYPDHKEKQDGGCKAKANHRTIMAM